MTFYSIMASISDLGKMDRTSAKSENPNDSLPTENLLLWIDLFRLILSERYAASVIFTRRQQ